jgi:hypothetical protein
MQVYFFFFLLLLHEHIVGIINEPVQSRPRSRTAPQSSKELPGFTFSC